MKDIVLGHIGSNKDNTLILIPLTHVDVCVCVCVCV